MSRVTAELPAGQRDLAAQTEAAWESRPRNGDFRDRFLWLLLIAKLFCLQNVNWILSAALHLAVTVCIAGVALHQHGPRSGIGIEGGLFEGQGEDGFENVLGDNQPQGGGGQPFETVLDTTQFAQQSGELAALNELARLGQDAAEGGDGGDGGGSGGGSGGGTGSGRGPGIGLGAGFFGSKGKGKSFIYVVDCSRSMYGTRFDRAKAELVRSINRLGEDQKFYVFFFNDRTFPLFDPKPAKGMLSANKNNKQRASAWIRNRKPDSTTNPTLALREALEMRPDVIFLLTDGELNDGVNDISLEVRQMLRNQNKSKVVIHTIAFENEEASATLEAIAKEHNGTFRFVR